MVLKVFMRLSSKNLSYINSLTNVCDSKFDFGSDHEEAVSMTDVGCESCQTNMF